MPGTGIFEQFIVSLFIAKRGCLMTGIPLQSFTVETYRATTNTFPCENWMTYFLPTFWGEKHYVNKSIETTNVAAI